MAAPSKQQNMSRPPLPTAAPAPTMTDAPIHLPIEASALVPTLRNMSRPSHPDAAGKEGPTYTMGDSSIKQRNMTRPPQPCPDPTSRNMTQPTLPAPEASSSDPSMCLPPAVPSQLESFDYSWADLDVVRRQCEQFPRNKVSQSCYNFLTDLILLECSWGEGAK